MIGGYLSSCLNNNDLCYCVDDIEDRLCAFLMTIIESEKHDKLVEASWVEQLHQKYPNENS